MHWEYKNKLSNNFVTTPQVCLPEYKTNYASLEFRIIKSEFYPNVRNSIQSEFPHNNQHGLPGKIIRLKITASFTTKLCAAFTYKLLHQLGICNCSNDVRKRCLLNAYWEVVYCANGFTYRQSVKPAILKRWTNFHVTFSRTRTLRPMIGICWINGSAWQSFPVCM